MIFKSSKKKKKKKSLESIWHTRPKMPILKKTFQKSSTNSTAPISHFNMSVSFAACTWGIALNSGNVSTPKRCRHWWRSKRDMRLQPMVRRNTPTSLRAAGGNQGDDCNSHEGHQHAVDVERVKQVTLQWVNDFVVGLNLCPFAEAVMREQSHRIVIHMDATTESDIWPIVQDEMAHLIRTPAAKVSTTLVVVPSFAHHNFLSFIKFAQWMEGTIESDEALVDEVMLACFHPGHEWADAATHKDAINFDKRAPFPIINILRAGQVDGYVEEGRTQGILERNHKTLEELGADEVNRRFHALYED